MTNIVTNADGSVTIRVMVNRVVVDHLAIGPAMWVLLAIIAVGVAWFVSKKGN
jgi:hypothetical protein